MSTRCFVTVSNGEISNYEILLSYYTSLILSDIIRIVIAAANPSNIPFALENLRLHIVDEHGEPANATFTNPEMTSLLLFPLERKFVSAQHSSTDDNAY